MADIFGAASERHREMLEKLAEFCGLIGIRYEDKGNGEEYTLYHSDGRSIGLLVYGNEDQGGFMMVDFGQSRLIANSF